MWPGGMHEGGQTHQTREFTDISSPSGTSMKLHLHQEGQVGLALAWWSTVESLSWCLEAPFAGASKLYRDIRPECAHAELFRYNWWCWGRRAPAASARGAGPGIAHAPGPLCTRCWAISTQHGLTKVSLRLHQGRGVNWSHITLLLTASAAGDQPRRHVQKEVMPLPNDRTARSRSPSHVPCVIVRQR